MCTFRVRGDGQSKVISLVVFALVLVLGAAFTPSFGAKIKPFMVFNSIGYIGTPDLSVYGMRPIKVIYEADLDDPPALFSSARRYSEKKISLAAQAAAKGKNGIVILDMETWGRSPEAMGKYVKAVREFKRDDPDSKVGMFEVMPTNIALPYTAYSKNRPELLQEWEKLQPIAEPVVREVDVLAPEVYTMGDDMEAWDKEARLFVRTARQAAPGKPVYVFIWPQYLSPHAGCKRGSKAAQFIPPSAWRNELETLYTVADGVILWSPRWACSPDSDVADYPKFNEHMPWFRETLAFMRAHSLH